MVRTFQYKKYVDTCPHTMSTGNFTQFFALNYRVFWSNGKSKQKFALIYRSFLSGGKSTQKIVLIYHYFLSGGKFTQFFVLIYRVFLSNGKFTEKMRKFTMFIYKNSSPCQTCHLPKETKSFLSLWTLNEWGYITLSFKVQSEWQVCVMSWVSLPIHIVRKLKARRSCTTLTASWLMKTHLNILNVHSSSLKLALRRQFQMVETGNR